MKYWRSGLFCQFEPALNMTSSLRDSIITVVPASRGKKRASFAQVEQLREVAASAIARQLPAGTEGGAVLTGRNSAGSQRCGMAEEAADCVRKRRG